MGKWIGKITKAGRDVLNDLLTAKTLAITDVRGCAGAVPEDELAELTEFPAGSQQGDTWTLTREAEAVRLKITFTAADSSYTLHRIGIWGRAGSSGTAVLLAVYQHTGVGVDIPAQADSPNFSYLHYAGLSITDAGAMAVTLEPTAAQMARDDASASATQAAAAATQAKTAQETAETVQAALHLRERVYVGPASMAADMLPGDILIVNDGGALVGGANYQDLLEEARKAAAGEANSLETMAVLSVVNATNWRRDADGALWTTDALADFRSKLTAFAAAAVAGGYVDETTGKCTATWAQGQYWLLHGTLAAPLEADAEGYTWRTEPPKTQLDTLTERVAALEAMLDQTANVFSTLANGG